MILNLLKYLIVLTTNLITLPNLSKIALIYIWLPVAGVDVERSFSDYKNILSEKGCVSLKNQFQCLTFCIIIKLMNK